LVPADSAGRTAQAQSHKAGRHAREESDRGEVPMKQPHKGVRAPAEVGEGRLRPKENMGQSHTPPAQNGERVSQGLTVCAKRRGKGSKSGSPRYCTISMSMC